MAQQPLDPFEVEGERVSVQLADATRGNREDGEIEWNGITFGWRAYFRWTTAGEPMALGIGEVYVRIEGQEEPGWRCARPRSIHKSVSSYAARILSRQHLRSGADPFKEDDEP
jgi:hypothetical protein